MSGDGELPGGVHGFLGPVEAGEGTAAPLPPLHPDPPVLSRRQKYALTAALLTFAVVLTARHAAHQPAQAANSPPYPSQIVHFSYGGPLPPGPDAFALRLQAHNDGPGPVDVLGIGQGYRGVTVVIPGQLPHTVGPGGSTDIQVVLRVTDCAGAPKDAELPYLDVTLRNTRAMETVSQILGDAYARDLSGALHSACPDSAIRTGTTSHVRPNRPVR